MSYARSSTVTGPVGIANVSQIGRQCSATLIWFVMTARVSGRYCSVLPSDLAVRGTSSGWAFH